MVVVAVVVLGGRLLFKVVFSVQCRVGRWVMGCCSRCCFGWGFGCSFGGYSCVGQTIKYNASMRCSNNVVSMLFKKVVLLMEVSSVAV